MGSTIVAVNKKSLKILEVKKIWNNDKLYYYYEHSHHNMTAKTNPNEKRNLRAS